MSRESLIESSKDLFLRYGVKSVSMDDIASILGISKKTIYTHVENKSELVESAISSFIDEEQLIVAEISKSADNAIDEITAIASSVIKMLRKMKPSLFYDLRKYYNKAWLILEKDHFAHIESTICSNIERGIKEGFYRKDLDQYIQSKIYVGLARIMVDESIFPTTKYERPYLYKHLISYHLNGIMNDKGRKELQKYFNKENLE